MENNNWCYTTKGGIRISCTITTVEIGTAMQNLLVQLDYHRGGLFASSYEYPGRYKRWGIGFVNPPLELAACGNSFTLTALNERGKVLLPGLVKPLYEYPHLQSIVQKTNCIQGCVQSTDKIFPEEKRSKQPSVFSVVRECLRIFYSHKEEYLGFYGAFGYDLVFQFESIPKRLRRSASQIDLLLYLPDELIVFDYYRQQAFLCQYEFDTHQNSTEGLPRTGDVIDWKRKQFPISQSSDYAPGEYAKLVQDTLTYFRRGDLFEVVPSQSFFEVYEESPATLFQVLQQINPTPYSFFLNLGGEYLIGASPEMFVRVEGRRVETCPISGTIKRGRDAIEDAAQIRQLLNSGKEEAELTMCTDVDRNDKSRICEPGSVRVLSRRQIELYSHLIHTVDHVEGMLRPGFDALDAFLSHTWAVTVTGAPKRAAIQFIEEHERSPRRWYGGAVGYLAFNGDLNTGLVLRTIYLKSGIAEVRVGATILYDSNPEAEEQETLTKAAALFQALHHTRQQHLSLAPGTMVHEGNGATSARNLKVLLIDFEDSFVHTLANYIHQGGATVKTLRYGFHDSILDIERPNLIVLSPGPGKPSDFKMAQTIFACIDRNLPLFGVCLGLQGIVEALGGELGVLTYPQHGKPSKISVLDPESILFRGLPQSFEAGRYHSLFALPDRLPPELKVTAVSEDGVIMAIEHRSLPIAAVQFHPESIMTLAGEVGLAIVHNVLHGITQVRETSASLVSKSAH